MITLNRPETRNALSTELMTELTEELLRQSRRGEVRVIVIRADGPPCPLGDDLKELIDRSLEEEREVFDVCTRMMETVQEIPQPVIAAVQGIATAAGCQLVATCDLAVASEDARFATPGVKIGLFCSTPMVAVSRAIGRKRAMEMLLTGEMIDARTALDWGLVNRVVPALELDEAVDQLAQAIVRSSPLTVGIGKEAFYAQIDLDEHRAYELTKSVMTLNSLAEDAQEGICAFMEKRPAKWRGR